MTEEGETGTPLADAADSFARSQRAANRSPKTIRLYRDAIDVLGAHLAASGLPGDIEAIRREHLEDHMRARLERVAASTANMEYRALAAFFRWAVGEEIIEVSPMARMTAPKVKVVPPPVLDLDQVQRLIDACRGSSFVDRRDMAVVVLLVDCGLRRSEVGNLTVEDIDKDRSRVYVTGKGDKGRWVSYGDATSVVLDRYLRSRRSHRQAGSPQLFLGVTSRPFGPSGVGQVLANRSRAAGLGRINPHRFRHTAAHTWLANGGSEGDLMQIMGWSSRQMLARYGASAASERAAAAQRARSIGARLGIKV